MSRKLLLFSIFLLFAFKSFSQNKLTDSAEISILTCSPGDDLYAAFGHSAIRVYDAANNIDWVFNYGTFDFNVPNFYGKFAKGKLNYMLSIEYYKSFARFYTEDNRDVWAQILDITPQKKQEIFDFLMWNAEDENKYYLYDFFWDNCATRIRDVLMDTYKDSIIFPERTWNISFRDMTDKYLEETPWIHFGIDLALGLPSDSIVDTYYAQYLPDYMDTIFGQTYILDEGKHLLVKERKQIINAEKPREIGFEKYITPINIFVFIFIIIGISTFYEYRNKKRFYAIDKFLLILFGFIGTFVLVLWLGTEHSGANYNLNALWALPLHLIAAFFNKKSRFFNLYLPVAGIYTLLFIPFMSIFPQYLIPGLIPLFLIFGLRFIILFIHFRKQ